MHDQRFTHSWFKIFLLSRFFHTCALVGERIDDCINNEEDTRSVYHHEGSWPDEAFVKECASASGRMVSAACYEVSTVKYLTWISIVLGRIWGHSLVKLVVNDPYIIAASTGPILYLLLLSSVLQALKVLDDDMQCDIIKIGNIIRNKVSVASCTSPLALFNSWMSLLCYLRGNLLHDVGIS